jgi:molecular chaperone DnaK
MDEKNNFALVRKPSSAVEKAAPGAKRILSGMVADTLALVRQEPDVTPLTLSIESGDGKIIEVIERNAVIPVRESLVLPESCGKGTTFEFNVLQGEYLLAAQNHCLCRCIVEGVILSANGKSAITVTFDIDTNGVLHIYTKDILAGKQLNVRTINYRGLSKNEIEKLQLESQALPKRRPTSAAFWRAEKAKPDSKLREERARSFLRYTKQGVFPVAKPKK